MRRLDLVRRGSERLRVGPWRGDERVAYVSPMAGDPPVSPAMAAHCCAVLAERGYREVVTAALAEREGRGFADAGFTVRDGLHLLVHDLLDVADSPPVRLRRGRRRHRAAALAVDAAAFPPFWRLDDAGLTEALTATPAARFRIAAPGGRRVAGYAVTGRAGGRGYLQRLAVDPLYEGQGLGRALAIDALLWLRKRGAGQAVVNTQESNERALRLYRSLGFRLQPGGLVVLGRDLVDRQPAR